MNGISPITIEAAGERMRHLASRLKHLAEMDFRSTISAADSREACAGYKVLDRERKALEDFVMVVSANSPVESLVQIDAIALPLEGVSSDDLAISHCETLQNAERVLVGISVVLSKAAAVDLKYFTASGLHDNYIRARKEWPSSTANVMKFELARSPTKALSQIDAIVLPLEKLVEGETVEDCYRQMAQKTLSVLVSAAGVLSDLAGVGLDPFKISGLDNVYSRVFPLVANSEFACAHLGTSC